MTKADNSETQRIGGWVPPRAPGGTEYASTAAGPQPRGAGGPVSQLGGPIPPSTRLSSRPVLALVAATALATLGYGIAAIVVLGDDPPRQPEFALPAQSTRSPAAASPPVSVFPAPPGGAAPPSRDIRRVSAGTTTRPGSGSPTPGRTASTPATDPAFTVGRTVGVGVTGLTGYRLRNRDFVARIEADSTARGLSGHFLVRQGLADAGCVSFESAEHPGFYLRHRNYVLLLERYDASGLYRSDATFCPQASGGGFALRSVNFPDHHLIGADGLVRLVRSTAAQATPFRALPPI
ncbi:AbfB domain-containing protein [Actinoplanes xinjiangensis]|uniref:AbfB domain-containing protein n=1 Tax=Actinoplanes xinjiangensis TaxID=512350 RepID=UPI00343F31FB